MATFRFPVITFSILAGMAGLYWLAGDPTLFYFSADRIAAGEVWRLLTGHFAHADRAHLLWNGLGLAVLGLLIEARSGRLLLATLGTGIAAVSILLLSPYSRLDYYCGLSGVLNTLLLVALWLEWRRTRSGLVIAIACGAVAKAVIEVSLGASVVTHISWPPYAWSHVAGLVGGLLLILVRSPKVFAPAPVRTSSHGRKHSAAETRRRHSWTRASARSRMLP